MDTLDRYEILGELGRGAISIVYDARDLLTDSPVALKLIEPSLWGPPTSAAERLRFLSNAIPEWRLKHRNIVTVYDAGDGDGRVYIAMERLEGRSLRRMLDESPLPAVPRSLRMAAEFASGLAHAHERGVVHLYVKPSNILILADDRLKITDFGMASLRDAALASRNHAACLGYMSPEQIRCDATIDGRSDIFSLGVVLYEMLTGKRPFSGGSPAEIMGNVLEAEPPLLSEVNLDVPGVVDLLVWNMLAKDPNARAPSAAIVARHLRGLSEKIDRALAAHARDDGVPAVVATTAGGPASGDRRLTLVPGHRGAPQLSDEVDDTLVAHARADEVPAVVVTTAELSEEVGDRLTAHARADGVPAAAAAGPSKEVGDTLTVHARADGVPAAAAAGPSEVVANTLTAHARADEVPAVVVTTAELSEEVGDRLTAHARADGVPAAAAAGPSKEVGDTLTVHARADGVPAAAAAGPSEVVANTLTAHARVDEVPAVVVTTAGLSEKVGDTLTAHARADRVPAEVATTAGERVSRGRQLALVPGHRGAPQETKLRLSNYAWIALILAAAGSGLLWQLRQSPDPSETRSMAISGGPVTAIAPEPSAPEEPRLAASEPEPKERASKAPAGKPSGSAVASGRAPARKVQPSTAAPRAAPPLLQANTATSIPAPAPTIQASVAAPATEPLAKTATLVFDVSPWGTIYIDGRPHGTTPPVTTLDVPPGRHRIEVRNSAQLPYLSSHTLQPGDVQRIRHTFE